MRKKKSFNGNRVSGFVHSNRAVFSGGVLATLAGISAMAQAAPAAEAVEPTTQSAAALREIDSQIENLQKALEQARSKRAQITKDEDTTAAPPPATPAAAAKAKASASDDTAGVTLDTVVVHARNREERLQDVPIPVSVVSGKELERDGAINISDFARKSTNVQAAELNSRRSSVSIRGVGKNVNGEEFEAPVGVIIDNVFQPYVGSSWADFTDVDHIEIARGPQGTLLGKNTTLGVLNITTKLPSFTPDSTIEGTLGERHSAKAAGSLTGPVIDNLLA